MKKFLPLVALCALALGATTLLTLHAQMAGMPAPAAAGTLDTAKIESLTGLKGSMNAKEGVFKVTYPRSDLNVTAAGVKLTPAMGLTCWVSFQTTGPGQVMAMGDTVLLEDQVNPVMRVALAKGLEVTAVHNHFFWDTPKVFFMHIGGMGDTDKVAAAVGKVYETLKATAGSKGEVLRADLDPAKSTLAPAKIDAVLGVKGDFTNGVYKATIGRTSSMGGHEVGNTMGVNTWAVFVGSDDQAAVMGDFAMYEDELQGVLKAITGAGIDVVAIHNHMAGENPRVVFLHYWGIGPTEKLAHGLKSALDTQHK